MRITSPHDVVNVWTSSRFSSLVGRGGGGRGGAGGGGHGGQQHAALVGVGSTEPVGVAVAVLVGDGVAVGGVPVAVGVAVGSVPVGVAVLVPVGEGVDDGVGLAVPVRVGLGVTEGVAVAAVGEGLGVVLGVRVGVSEAGGVGEGSRVGVVTGVPEVGDGSGVGVEVTCIGASDPAATPCSPAPRKEYLSGSLVGPGLGVGVSGCGDACSGANRARGSR